MKILRLVCIVASSFIWLHAAAESTDPATTTLSKHQQRLADLWELELAVLNRPATKTDQSIQLRRIVVYEKLAEIYCMPLVAKGQHHPGGVAGKQCHNYFDELVALHPHNHVARCILHGTNSDVCAEAYQQRIVVAYSGSSPKDASGNIDLEAKLASYNSADSLRQTRSELGQAAHQLRKLPLPKELKTLSPEEQSKYQAKQIELSRQLRLLHSRMLLATCGAIRETAVTKLGSKELRALEKRVQANKAITPSTETQKLINMIDKLGEGPHPQSLTRASSQKQKQLYHTETNLFKEPTPTATTATPPQELWRIRYLPSSCASAIEDALRFDSNFSLALCYLEGSSSPPCLQSKQMERNNTKIGKRGPNALDHQPSTALDGIDSF